jgi:hypothetical protein
MAQDTKTLEAKDAWFYHVQGEGGQEIVLPENHDLTLDPTRDWCVTHRPQTPCTCGQYELEWQ